MKFSHAILLFLVLMLLPWACTKDDDTPATLNIFTTTLNGANFTDGLDNVPLNTSIVVVFSSAVLPIDFEKEFTLSPTPTSQTFAYSNQSSKVTIDLVLAPQTTYQVSIGQGNFGQNGGGLENPFTRSFTTMADDVIHSQPPCTSATNDCLQTISLTNGTAGDFDFYASFPIYEEMAEWEDLEAAVIVVHGANRDADNYFNFLINTLQAESLVDKVVLIAPHFKNGQEATGNDFYWTDTGWREGNNSLGPVAISSFEILDQLLGQLADKAHFPNLKKIIVTGHSSGGLFTHLYAPANKAEAQYPGLAFEYVVANSQYFYYPDGQRIDENTNQLYTPTGCTGYDIYPAGFSIVPPYIAAIGKDNFDSQFTSRSITYLLGNGNGADPALNTSNCSATLLGSTRYQRGENMFRYMELKFPGGHNHQKAIVAGIGHDGQGMYQSPEFRSLILQLLN